MPRAVYRELLDNSLSAVLSAIELYNKPDFKYREESFVILAINAWELLLKAKIVKDGGKKAIYVKDGFHYKRSRTGNLLTIEIRGALEKIGVDELVRDNLDHLLEIRDTAIHFYNKDSISYAIFTLGAASLQNFQKLAGDWFDIDLTKYNFYILPLGFKYSFKNFEMIKLENEPEAVQNLLAAIVSRQDGKTTESNGFYLVADVRAEVVSAKKIADPQIKVAIDPSSSNRGIIRPQRLIDKYPISATELWEQVHENLPMLSQTKYYKFLNDNKLRGNPDYSAFNFRTKLQEDEYEKSGTVPNSIAPIYNQDAIEFILANIDA